MKRMLASIIVLFSIFTSPVWSSNTSLAHAYASQQNDIQVQGQGKIIRLLADDTRGSQHQKFIIRLANNQTILIAHNIDLAPKVPDLTVGNRIEFYGEYEWNSKGGVVHWTHKDPRHLHIDGWLKYQGKKYD